MMNLMMDMMTRMMLTHDDEDDVEHMKNMLMNFDDGHDDEQKELGEKGKTTNQLGGSIPARTIRLRKDYRKSIFQSLETHENTKTTDVFFVFNVFYSFQLIEGLEQNAADKKRKIHPHHCLHH